MLSGRGIDNLSNYSVDVTTEFLYINDNEFRSLKCLTVCPAVKEIIADNNHLTENLDMPLLQNLHTLSLNKNQITDLETLVDQLAEKTPNLKFLSLLGNPACPDSIYRHICSLSYTYDGPEDGQMEGDLDDDIDVDEEHDDDDEYNRYRLRLLYRLPGLKFVDSSPVTAAEITEARRRGPYLRVVRAPSATSSALVSMTDEEDTPVEETPLSQDGRFTPLPTVTDKVGKDKAAFGRCRYVYNGKHSEGNRFITNPDL